MLILYMHQVGNLLKFTSSHLDDAAELKPFFGLRKARHHIRGHSGLAGCKAGFIRLCRLSKGSG